MSRKRKPSVAPPSPSPREKFLPALASVATVIAGILFVYFLLHSTPEAFASQVTATVTGNVISGTDHAGYFYPPGTDLSSKPYTLVFTMDDSKGVTYLGTWPSCDNGLKNSGLDTPTPTATLTINGKDWTVGAVAPASLYTSEVATANYTSPQTEMDFGPRDDLGLGGLRGTIDEIWGAIYLGTTVCRDWETAYTHALSGTDTGSFQFSNEVWSTSSTSPAVNFGGYLGVSGVTVSGPFTPSALSADDPENWGCCNKNATRSPPVMMSTPTGGTAMSTAPSTATGIKGGDPVNAADGNMVLHEADYIGPAHTQLSFIRTYNSFDQTEAGFGIGWRSTYHRALIIGSGTIKVVNAEGREDTFTQSGSDWVPDSNITSTLVSVGSNYQLTLPDDTVENYNGSGQLTSIVLRNGQTTSLTYTSGNLTTVTGPFGQTLTFGYDASNRVTSMTLPNGTDKFNYGYDGNDNLAWVENPDGTYHQFAYGNPAYPHMITALFDEDGNPYADWQYDSNGRTTVSEHAAGVDKIALAYTGTSGSSVTDANGNTHTYGLLSTLRITSPSSVSGAPDYEAGGAAFAYDGNGFLQTLTDYDGNETYYTHNSAGEETTRTEAYGTSLARTTTTTWNATWHLPDYVYEPNRTTHFTYDSNGNMLTQSITDGTVTRTFTYTYNGSGQVLTLKDPDNNTTTLTYTSTGGNVATYENPLGQTTTYTSYDAAGHLLSETNPNGLVTSFTYDTVGRVLTKKLTAGSASLTTTYTWDPASGKLLTVKAPDASTLTMSYDDAHRLIKVKDTAGDYTTYSYDDNSNVTEIDSYDPSSNLKYKHTWTYNSANLPATSNGASLGETTTFNYDSQGSVTSATDALGNTTTWTYDALNRMATMQDALGNTTTFAYTNNDDIASVTDPRGLVTSYAHDGLSDTTSLSSPDAGLTVNTYDDYGNLSTATDARSDTATYYRDALNRVTTISYTGGASVGFTYDGGTYGKGHLTQMVDPAGTTSWTYDEFGRVTQKKEVIGTVTLTMNFSYDSYGRIYSIEYPSGRYIYYTYDSSGRVQNVELSASYPAYNVKYQPFGPAYSWTENNSTTMTRTYDQDGRITSIALGSTTTANTQTITYNNAGNITALSETVTSLFPSETFGYDADNRLSSFFNGTTTESYSYDANGNRSSTALSGTTTYSYSGSSNMLASLSGTTTESFSHDSDGNTTADGSNTYHYDARGYMDSTTAMSVTTTYGINGFGQRLYKTGSGVSNGGTNEYMYDLMGNLIGEYSSTGGVIEETVFLPNTPISAYLGGYGTAATATPIAVLTGSGGATVSSVTADWRPAPHIIANSSKQMIWVWNTYAFGENGPNQNPYGVGAYAYNRRFPIQLADAETGISYNIMRFYRPGLGLYYQPDSLGLAGGQLSSFPYANGNPLTRLDPYGLFCWPVFFQSVQSNFSDANQSFYDSMFGTGANIAKGLPASVTLEMGPAMENASGFAAPFDVAQTIWGSLFGAMSAGQVFSAYAPQILSAMKNVFFSNIFSTAVFGGSLEAGFGVGAIGVATYDAGWRYPDCMCK